jgi:hypothetical protein
MGRLSCALLTAIALTQIADAVPLRAADDAANELKMIEALIMHLEGLEGAVFVRNGQEYDSARAASFVRSKWKAKRSAIKTAADFIEKAASISSTTGNPYLIRFTDGREVKGRDYLFSQLNELNGRHQPLAGVIFVRASLRQATENAGNFEIVRSLIALDVKTEAWHRLEDDGEALRLSPDGRSLAWLKENDQELWIGNASKLDGRGRFSDKWGFPVWSPEGKFVVTSTLELSTAETPRLGYRTWKTPADGSGQPERMAVSDSDVVHDWSADGHWLVTTIGAPFTVTEKLAKLREQFADVAREDWGNLYIQHPDGTGRRGIVTSRNVYAFNPRFSPDSRQIVYAREEQGKYSIRVIELESGQERTILPDSDPGIVVHRACWSPDGLRLAVLEYNSQVAGADESAPLERANHRIVLVDPDGNNRHNVTLRPQGSVEAFPIDSIDWRPARN